jgi:hypothetical protein
VRLSQGPDDIQPPHSKGPRDGDFLQDVLRKVGLAGVELAPFGGAHDLTGISNRGGLVEALAEHVAHEGCVALCGGRIRPRRYLEGARAPEGWARITAGCPTRHACTARRRRG